MSKTIMKCLLALCLICNVGNAFAQHRYYCEVKGIEKQGGRIKMRSPPKVLTGNFRPSQLSFFLS